MMANQSGTLYWITGLAGAGKTTLGRRLCQTLKAQGLSVVFLDGDDLREVYGIQGQYSHQQRLDMAMRHARMCRLITTQNTHVVCATISLFAAVRQWNRKHIPNYTEIFLDASEKALRNQDSDRFYAGYERGAVTQVVGKDIAAEWPQNPNLTITIDEHKNSDSVFAELMQGLSHT